MTSKVEFVKYVLKDPTPEETKEEERYWGNIRHYCPHCKKATTFVRCYACSKRFCLEHAYEETDGTWETGYHIYPVCYHCSPE